MTVHKGAWPPGTPCWVDLSVSDMQRSQEFYGAVFGWEFSQRAEEFGGYSNAFLRGSRVAGMSPPSAPDAYLASAWTVYLATDDSEATDAAINEAGGQTLFPITQVGVHGRMALYVDVCGARFGTWEAAKHGGYELVSEPGAVAWCEGLGDNYQAGKDFYEKVFGYRYTELPGEGAGYAMFIVPQGRRVVGGIGETVDGGPPVWTVTFEVEDVDATAAAVRAAGGRILAEPFDYSYGRLAMCQGLDREKFGISFTKHQ